MKKLFLIPIISGLIGHTFSYAVYPFDVRKFENNNPQPTPVAEIEEPALPPPKTPSLREVGMFQTPYFYIKALGGVDLVHAQKHDGIKPHFDTGYIVSGTLGYHWHYGFALEAEYAYRRNSLDSLWYYGLPFDVSGDYWSSSCMANLLWDFPSRHSKSFWGRLYPYMGAGVGYDFQRIRAHKSGFVWKEKGDGFAWQAIGGIRYLISPHFDIGIEYKFHKGPLDGVSINSIGLSLSYAFGYKKHLKVVASDENK